MVAAAPGPLAGVRVVELAHHLAGPTCGIMLADMGADVIKVERVPEGDDSRRSVPPELGGESAAFMMINRNKRGIAVDLKNPAGRDVVLKLIDRADVVTENYSRGVMERLGLGYDFLRSRNRGLVYCTISGFGRTGPYADRRGFDLVAQGMTGLMSITGESPERPPVKVGAPVTDITAGFLAAMGILAAYAHRLKTGEGQIVDTSLFEAGIIHTFWQSAITFATGAPPRAMGSAHPLNAPYQAFQTADGWINVGGANQQTWLKLLDVLDAPDLNSDPRFASNKARMENLTALQATLAPYFKKRASADWLARFDRAGVAGGPILDLAQVHADPQTKARGMVAEVEHAKAGRMKTLGPPIKFSATPAAVRRAAPLLGQHTREVLREIGYDEAAIDRLQAEGAVIGDG
jgi:crotonobetainyl-CoA:carnitine CoA-transferase CaiB-like acyl-CoA transferase